HLANAFITLSEPTEGFRSVWGNTHEEAPQVAPVRQVDDRPGWLQVIHDRNISNRVRGRRAPATRLHEEFSLDFGDEVAADSAPPLRGASSPAFGDEVAADSGADYWLDGGVRPPARVARDGAFRVAKPVRHAFERATAGRRAR